MNNTQIKYIQKLFLQFFSAYFCRFDLAWLAKKKFEDVSSTSCSHVSHRFYCFRVLQHQLTFPWGSDRETSLDCRKVRGFPSAFCPICSCQIHGVYSSFIVEKDLFCFGSLRTSIVKKISKENYFVVTKNHR